MHRSITRPFFTKDRIKDFEVFDRHTMKAINKMKERFNEGYALNFEVGSVRNCSLKHSTDIVRTQDVIFRFTLDAACEFLFETTLQALDSELAYPHIKSQSGNHTPAREITREEAFSQALIGAETVLSHRLNDGDIWVLKEFFKDKTDLHMKVINEFLNPVLERGLAKHAARTEAGPADSESKILLDSLLQETSGWVTLMSYRGPPN